MAGNKGHGGQGIDTKLVHGGTPAQRPYGAAVFPIFQSVTYGYNGSHAQEADTIAYLRPADTPNHHVLAVKLADLEGTEAAVVTSSGMAAISSTLMAFLRPGDHLLVQSAVYGGTWELLHHDLADIDVAHTAIDIHKPKTWEAHLRSRTKVLYVETINNPLIEVGHLEALAVFAKRHNLVAIIDNTFATPVNFRPAEWGYDIILHSATKYLNGHSDVLAGAACASRKHIHKIMEKITRFGGTLDPHACFLLERGLKTLALRVRQQNKSALALAEFLSTQPQVAAVHYPGLQKSPYHPRAKTLFGNNFGGVLAFEVYGGEAAADRMLAELTIPLVAPSLGSVESLVTRPAKTTHLGLGPEGRKEAGIAEGLVRVSVGIESTSDLIKDFAHALSVVAAGLSPGEKLANGSAPPADGWLGLWKPFR